MIAHLFVLSKKAAKKFSPLICSNICSHAMFILCLLAPIVTRWNLIFNYWPFLCVHELRMNINLKLMKRMVHSVFGVVWSVYNE